MINKRVRKTVIKIKRPFCNSAGIIKYSFLKKILPNSYENIKISLCTTVMNRFEHLQNTVIKNIEDNESYENCEFVVLNYSCPDHRTQNYFKKNLRNYIESKRLKYFYYPDADYYNMSHSRNMAFRLATGEIICSVDADNYTGKDFAKYVALSMRNGDSFLRGPSDGRGLAGRICVYKKHFLEVGGYDERFIGWGGEDADIANRLCILGLKRKSILIEKYLNSIQHPRDIRVMQYANNKKVPSESRTNNMKIAKYNVDNKIINPNGSRFGMGRIQNINGQWQNLKSI